MAFISNTEINSIRQTANIVDIVGSYIPLTQRGRNFICVCPFHDDHSPSMSVSEEKQIYKCFACGATGNVFTFVKEYENVSFSEAISIVANKCGMELSENSYTITTTSVFKEEYAIMELANKFYQNNLKTQVGVPALEYLHNRGIDDETIKEFGIGLSLDETNALEMLLTKKNYNLQTLEELSLVGEGKDYRYDLFTRRITFPLWDKEGRVVGFSGRVYRGEQNVSKYINSKETRIFKKGETLYNFHKAKDIAKKEKAIILVEGFMDAIRLSVNGVKNVVALCGTAMTHEQAQMLKKIRVKVILCFDNDNAGLLATITNGEELVKQGVETLVIRLSGEKDPDEYIIKNGIDAFKENVLHPITFFDFKMNYLKQGKDLNKVEDLTLYINNVLKELSNNDDVILRELTLNQLSEEHHLSIEVLKDKLKELSPVEVKKKEVRKVPPKEKKEGYQKACERILYYMMNGVEYIEKYQKKLGYFSDALYREIANEILYYQEQHGRQINVADFITYVIDKESIQKKVMDIVNEASNEEVTMEAMEDYLRAISKVMTKNEINRLKDMMKNELDVDKKMKIAMQIADLKKDVF